MSYSVAKNTSFLTIASIMQKVISFVYFTIIARLVGVENTGQYFFAIAFTTIFTVVADLGLSSILTREASRYPENTEKYLNTVFWSKAVFGVFSYILVVAAVNILNYPSETRNLVYLSGITMFFDNLHSVFYAVFRARKNLFYESIGVVASQFITLVVGSIALFLHWPLYWLIIAYTIPSFLNFVYSAIFLRRVYKMHYCLEWRQSVFKPLLIMAVPFALAAGIGRLYSYSDTLIMSKLLTPHELGLWSVPYKITFAFQFVPIALSASVYPVFSSLYLENKEKIDELFAKSWRYLFTIVFPLAAGLFVLAEPAIVKLYGVEYLPAVPVLRILLISLIFGFLSFITGALLNGINRQKLQTALITLSLVVNVICNLILMPRYGIIGAACSALVGNFVLCIGGYICASRFITIRHLVIFKYINQTIWPAVIMGGIVYYLSFQMNFILTVPIGAAVYGALLFLTGGMNLSLLKESLAKVRA